MFGASVQKLLQKMKNDHAAAILSPKSYSAVKSDVEGLPKHVKNAILNSLNGLPLVYGKLDPGTTVMKTLPNGAVVKNKSNLYNQVVHQLSEWYMIIPKDDGSLGKVLFKMIKQKAVAIFELNGVNPHVIDKMKLGGEQWVGAFYTEQNTLKKTGNRVLLWSNNQAVFKNQGIAGTDTAAGSAVQAAREETDAAAKIDPRREYMVVTIYNRLLRLLEKLKKWDILGFQYSKKSNRVLIYKPIRDDAGRVIVQCDGHAKEMTNDDWLAVAENFDKLEDRSFKYLQTAIGGYPEWKTEFTAAFDQSGINLGAVKNGTKTEPTDDQKREREEITSRVKTEFDKTDFAGINFQVVFPGGSPEYNATHFGFQGIGWVPSDEYTVTFMFPGVSQQKIFGEEVLAKLLEYGIDMKPQYEDFKKKFGDKIRLAAVFDDGFPRGPVS